MSRAEGIFSRGGNQLPRHTAIHPNNFHHSPQFQKLKIDSLNMKTAALGDLMNVADTAGWLSFPYFNDDSCSGEPPLRSGTEH